MPLECLLAKVWVENLCQAAVHLQTASPAWSLAQGLIYWWLNGIVYRVAWHTPRKNPMLSAMPMKGFFMSFSCSRLTAPV